MVEAWFKSLFPTTINGGFTLWVMEIEGELWRLFQNCTKIPLVQKPFRLVALFLPKALHHWVVKLCMGLFYKGKNLNSWVYYGNSADDMFIWIGEVGQAFPKIKCVSLGSWSGEGHSGMRHPDMFLGITDNGIPRSLPCVNVGWGESVERNQSSRSSTGLT